jgi:uncharacterized protein YbjT (DUF2867 family)
VKITVFGATGGVGQEIVRQGLARDYAITAVVRDAGRLAVTDPALRVVTVPALDDPGTLIPAIRGSEAVLSGVGPHGRKDGPVAAPSTRAIVDAMNVCSTRRFVGVSAAPVGPIPDDEGLLNRWLLTPVVKALLRNVYADLGEMEALLQSGNVDWTVVRPPKLVNKPLSGEYRTALGANVIRGSRISRADVAHLMLKTLAVPETIGKAVGVAY